MTASGYDAPMRTPHVKPGSNIELETDFTIAHRLGILRGQSSFESVDAFANSLHSNARLAAYIDKAISTYTHPDLVSQMDSDEQIMLGILFQFHKLMRWAEFGFNTFDVSSGLCQRLLLTDPSSAPSIPMPYGTFLIRLQEGDLPWEGHSVRSIWIHRHRGKDVDAPVVLVEARGLPMESEACCYIAPWEDFFKSTVSADDGTEIRAEEINVTKSCARLAANLCFYLASQDGRGELSHKPHRPAYDKRPGISWPRCWALGKALTVDPRLSPTGEGEHAGAKLKFKHIVRGHWRNQACGPGHSERRVIWIQPFWKGPDVDEAWSHAYRVKE